MIPVTLSSIVNAIGAKPYHMKNDIQIYGISTDSRKIKENELFVALRGEKFDGNDFLQALNGKAAAAICERYDERADYPLLVVKNAKYALGLLSKYYKENVAGVQLTTAITGSVGKTTTKEMTSLALSAGYSVCKTKGNFNNDIGLPLTLLSIESTDTALVCEMGMSAKGEISYLTSLARPDIAMISNIGISHIENLGSREKIRNAKCEIIEGLKKEGTLILNGDEPLLREIDAIQKIIYVGMGSQNDVYPEQINMSAESVSFSAVILNERHDVFLPCVGVHNVLNALFALAAAYAAGVDLCLAARRLADYKTVGLRQNIIKTTDNITIIADCYNAGVESMTSALQVLSDIPGAGRKIAVLGDMLELGEKSIEAHLQIGKKSANSNVNMLFLYGKMSEYIGVGAKENGMDEEKIRRYGDKKEMACDIKNFIRPGDIILFKASRGMKFEEMIELAFDLERDIHE